jgi:hypothetical protein
VSCSKFTTNSTNLFLIGAGTKSHSGLQTYIDELAEPSIVAVRRLGSEYEVFMACNSCGSEKQTEFGAEMNIRRLGLKGLDKPIVWVFPKVSVCFGCGSASFTIPESELRQLESGLGEQD